MEEVKCYKCGYTLKARYADVRRCRGQDEYECRERRREAAKAKRLKAALQICLKTANDGNLDDATRAAAYAALRAHERLDALEASIRYL